MARIPEQTIEQIRNTADILDVVSEYVILKKRGTNNKNKQTYYNRKFL